MPLLTFVARVVDGMLLVASVEYQGPNADDIDMYKTQAKHLLKTLDAGAPSKCSIESGAFTFHYAIEDSCICYLTMSEKAYPKRLAFMYLEELHHAFVAELRQDYGDNWRRELDSVARPYKFIKFDKVIQKKRRDFANPSASNNMQRLQSDLDDIQSIMKKNIADVLERGGKLSNVAAVASQIRDESGKLQWQAKRYRIWMQVQKHAPVIGIGLLVLFILWYKFLW